MDVNGIIANLFSTFSVYMSYHGYLPSQVDFFDSGLGLPNSDFRFLFENMKQHALGHPVVGTENGDVFKLKRGRLDLESLGEKKEGNGV